MTTQEQHTAPATDETTTPRLPTPMPPTRERTPTRPTPTPPTSATPHEPKTSPLDNPAARARREHETEYHRVRKLEREAAEAAAIAAKHASPAQRVDLVTQTYICPRCDRPLALDHFPRTEDAELDYRMDWCKRCLRVNEIEFDLHPLGDKLQSLALEVWTVAADLNGGATRKQLDSALKRARRRKGAPMPPESDIEYVSRELVIHQFALDVWGVLHTLPAPQHMNPPKTY